MTNEELLVSNYENSRRDRLRSVIADYLGDAGATAQFIVDEFKAELNDQLAFYRQKVDTVSEAVNLLDTHHNGTYPVTITPDDPTLLYNVGAGNTAAYPTATYAVDGHGDVHVSIADTGAQPYNIDTTMYGDVSIASSVGNPTGYYDHDAAGPYYVESTPPETYPVPEGIDYTNPNPGIASSEANPTGYYGTYNTEQVAVASSTSDPAGDYGAGGISPEQLQGGERHPYGQHGNFQDNMPPT